MVGCNLLDWELCKVHERCYLWEVSRRRLTRLGSSRGSYVWATPVLCLLHFWYSYSISSFIVLYYYNTVLSQVKSKSSYWNHRRSKGYIYPNSSKGAIVVIKGIFIPNSSKGIIAARDISIPNSSRGTIAARGISIPNFSRGIIPFILVPNNLWIVEKHPVIAAL